MKERWMAANTFISQNPGFSVVLLSWYPAMSTQVLEKTLLGMYSKKIALKINDLDEILIQVFWNPACVNDLLLVGESTADANGDFLWLCGLLYSRLFSLSHLYYVLSPGVEAG